MRARMLRQRVAVILGRRGTVLAGPGFLLASICILFWRVLWPPVEHGLYGVDLWYAVVPWWRLWLERVRVGDIPLWNPYGLLGTPFLANPQTAQFYPPHWLFLVIPFHAAIGWGAALHVGLSAIGVYAFAGCMQVSRWGRTVAGLAYAFSSLFVMRIYAGHYSLMAVAAWFPWLLYAGFRVCRHACLRNVVVTAGVLSLTFLAGFPPILPVVVGFAGLAWLIWALRQPSVQTRWRIALALSLSGLLAVLLSAAALVPLLEFVRYSSRLVHPTYEFATTFSLLGQSFATMVAPHLLVYVVAFWEFHLFAGVVPLVLGFVGLARAPRRSLIWFGVAAFTLLLALGDRGGVFPVLYRVMPWLGLLRAPARFTIVYFLSLSILAGIGMDSLLASKRSSTGVMTIVLVAGLLVVAVVAQADRLLANGAVRVLVVSDCIRWFCVIGLLCAGDRMMRHHRRSLLGLLVVALAVLDLLSNGSRYILAEPLDPESRWQQIDAALPQDRSSYRLLTIGELDHNQGQALGFYGVGGYDSLIVAWAREMIDISLELHDPVLDVLSVRYVVHDTELPTLRSRAELVIKDKDLFVYERPNPMPRAFSVGRYELVQEPLTRLRDPSFNPRDQALLSALPNCVLESSPEADLDVVAIRAYEPDYVRINAVLRADRLVVLNDLYYPGWDALVDGNPVDVLQVNHALRGVCVPSGEHTVEFRYRPWWLVPVFVVSLAAWGSVLVFLVYWTGSRMRCALWPGSMRGESKTEADR